MQVHYQEQCDCKNEATAEEVVRSPLLKCHKLGWFTPGAGNGVDDLFRSLPILFFSNTADNEVKYAHFKQFS